MWSTNEKIREAGPSNCKSAPNVAKGRYDQDGHRYRGRMMGGGMMGRGMMGGGYGYHDGDRGAMRPGMWGPPMMMRMIFSLMDADGDGLSLLEFQAAHERIFKAMDANKDGFVTLEEMQVFIRRTGHRLPSSSLASE